MCRQQWLGPRRHPLAPVPRGTQTETEPVTRYSRSCEPKSHRGPTVRGSWHRAEAPPPSTRTVFGAAVVKFPKLVKALLRSPELLLMLCTNKGGTSLRGAKNSHASSNAVLLCGYKANMSSMFRSYFVFACLVSCNMLRSIGIEPLSP